MKPLNPKDIKADQELALRLKTLQEERSGLLSRDSLPIIENCLKLSLQNKD